MVENAFDNPLNDGLRIEPAPGPTTLVIFGASGDLTRRKLLPAVYQLSRRGRLAAQFSVVGVARTEMDDEQFRRQFRDCLKEFSGVSGGQDDVAESLASRMFYLSGEMDSESLYRAAPRAPGRDRRRAGRAVLPRDSADRVCSGDRAARPRQALENVQSRMAADHRRETLRSGSRERAHAQSSCPRALRRRADLSNRSLPGQGDRPESARLQIRQRHVRAGLEPPVHRSRADHRGGDRRRRAPCLVLRGRRRAAGHGAEPSDAGARARGDGAADRVHGGERSRSKDGCAALRSAARCRRRRPAARAERRPGAVSRGVGERRRGACVSGRERRRPGVEYRKRSSPRA